MESKESSHTPKFLRELTEENVDDDTDQGSVEVATPVVWGSPAT